MRHSLWYDAASLSKPAFVPASVSFHWFITVLSQALKAVQQGHDTRRYQEIMAAPQHKERLQALGTLRQLSPWRSLRCNATGIEANDKWLRERQKESDVLQGQLESRVNSAKNSNDAGRIWVPLQ